MIDIFQRDHAQAAADRLRKMELDRLSARDRGRDFFHAIDLLQLALCLRCFTCLGAKSIGKQLQRRDFFLLIFVSGELLFFARCFLLDVTVPVAAITHQFRVRDLDDAADKLIQKFAIVRDHQLRPDNFAVIPGTIEAIRDRDDSSVRRAEGGRVPSRASARDERA